jgi:hypothetical protein
LVNQVVSTVLSGLPKFHVQPRTPFYQDFAEFSEVAANNDWQSDYSPMRQVRLCAKDCAAKGIGIMYTIPEMDFGEATRERRKRIKLAEKLNADVRAGLADLADEETMAPSLEYAETGVENHDLSRVGRIGSRRIDPWRYGFDWTAESEHDMRFQWRWYYATRESLEAQKHWNQAAIRKLNFGSRNSELFSHTIEGDPCEYVRVFEGWFKDPGGKWNLRVWFEGAGEEDEFLYQADNPLIHGHPFRLLRWGETGNTIWCASDLLHVYQSLVMERHVQTRMYDQMMRQAVDVTIVDAAATTEDELHPVEVDGIGTLLRLDLGGKRPDEVFKRLQRDPVSTELLAYLQLLQRQIEDGVALDANQIGRFGKSETSATEIMRMDKAARSRNALRFVAVDEFVAGIAHDRLRMHVQYSPSEMIRALAGPKAAALFSLNTFTDGDVQFGLHVSVIPGTLQPVSDESKAASLQEVLLLLLQGNPTATAMVNAPALFLEWLKTKGIHEGSNLLMPGIDGQAVQALAMQMAMAGKQGGSPAAAAGQSNAATVA